MKKFLNMLLSSKGNNKFDWTFDDIRQEKFSRFLKGTLMQIWKSVYMFLFIQKYYSENFAFLILRIPELYTRKVCEMFVYKHTETVE